jgi:hypothetical protein
MIFSRLVMRLWWLSRPEIPLLFSLYKTDSDINMYSIRTISRRLLPLILFGLMFQLDLPVPSRCVIFVINATVQYSRAAGSWPFKKTCVPRNTLIGSNHQYAVISSMGEHKRNGTHESDKVGLRTCLVQGGGAPSIPVSYNVKFLVDVSLEVGRVCM